MITLKLPSWHLLALIFLISWGGWAFADDVKPVLDASGQLDVAHYKKLSMSQPQQLLAELGALIEQPSTEANVEMQLHARYLMASTHYYLSQRNEIKPLAQAGLALAEAHAAPQFKARYLGILAIAELNDQNEALATQYTARSLAIVEGIAPNSELHGDMLMLAAQVYYESGALQNALKVMVKASGIFSDLGDAKNRSEVLGSIALIYDELGQPDKAIEYHLRSLELIDPAENLVEASITYYNIALTYRHMGKNEQAASYAQLSLESANKAGDKIGAAYAIYELASVEEELGNYEPSLAKINSILPIFEDNSITGMTILSHLLRARLRAKLNLPGWDEDLAIAEPLVEKMTTLKRRIALVRSKAMIYELQGQYALALDNYKAWVALNDEQLKESQEQSTRRYQSMFELKEVEAENQLLYTEKKLAETELAAKEFRQLLLILLSVVLLIILFAAVAFLVIQIKTKQRFKTLAMVDDLTQTRNRRSISTFAQNIISASKASSAPVCFALVDIDHFKSFNDRFGHDVGDEVLKKVAKAIASELRADDALGRWGGEEWLLVLPNNQCHQIENVFARIQKKLKHLDLQIDGAPVVTISMGCTDLNDGDGSVEQVVKRADEALYKAKENGRNRFEVAVD
ncbi:tetratricopeptide repeat-containing diguanylate cyclase [Simiduia aestuariiviva]|uniref:diguanylate cyclase n=1 Tax=Simiduia aestuariiviva TaxID=1510459 RepID=A0A839UH91_9GAMM|nr:tetratricopeptide repeat-containing diguanylate cyclase [Simiduia aestuariiviva]MBB3167404.1 diguanylate cyclase (GGDEF)-like protein [Simiduia aestuariiviva]